MADGCRLGGKDYPNTSLLDGKGEKGAEGGGDNSGGSATQEVGKENSAECILDWVESGGYAINNSLEILPLLLETFLRAMKTH